MNEAQRAHLLTFETHVIENFAAKSGDSALEASRKLFTRDLQLLMAKHLSRETDKGRDHWEVSAVMANTLLEASAATVSAILPSVADAQITATVVEAMSTRFSDTVKLFQEDMKKPNE